MNITKKRLYRQAVFHYPRSRGLLLQVDAETQTILYARQLIRRHPEIITRIFAGKDVSVEQAVRSVRDIACARDAIFTADNMGLTGRVL